LDGIVECRCQCLTASLREPRLPLALQIQLLVQPEEPLGLIAESIATSGVSALVVILVPLRRVVVIFVVFVCQAPPSPAPAHALAPPAVVEVREIRQLWSDRLRRLRSLLSSGANHLPLR
jgi:hypothetical protein